MQPKLHASSPKSLSKRPAVPARRSIAPPSAAIAVAAAVLGTGLLALPAMADAPPRTSQGASTVKVAYADLDLSRAAGAQPLLQRIKSAARDACGPEPVVSGLRPRAAHQHRACVDSAVSMAVERINAPQLTALVQPAQQVAAR